MRILKSTNGLVCIVSVVSFIWGVVYKLYLIDLPPLFTKAYQVAEITYNLTTSVVASAVFYYIVVYLEQRRIRNTLAPLIKSKLTNFAISEHAIRTEITRAVFGVTYEKSLEELKAYFDRIDMSDKPVSPHFCTNWTFNTWYELFDYYFGVDGYRLKSLLSHISYLHPEVIVKLDLLDYSIFQRSLDNAREHHLPNYLLSGTAGPFLLYMNTLKELASMSDTHV